MPTGYTAGVQDGTVTDFNRFALQCARAFGACIMQRDDDPDEPPKKQEVYSYYQEKYEETLKKYEEFKCLSDDEISKTEREKIEKDLEHARQRVEERNIQEARYFKMLTAVKAWNPPTEEHEGLKKFMIEQLRDSIDFDCGGSYYEEEITKYSHMLENMPSIEEIKREKCEDFERDLAYYKEAWDKEVERVNAGNKWIDDLYKSLYNES